MKAKRIIAVGTGALIGFGVLAPAANAQPPVNPGKSWAVQDARKEFRAEVREARQDFRAYLKLNNDICVRHRLGGVLKWIANRPRHYLKN